MNTNQSPRPTTGQLLKREVRALFTVNPSDRPWEMPAAVALASGGPLVLGATFGAMGAGAIASIGGMAILYLPRTPFTHRVKTVSLAAIGMTACYGLVFSSKPAWSNA